LMMDERLWWNTASLQQNILIGGMIQGVDY
jgi:hypothetical protein